MNDETEAREAASRRLRIAGDWLVRLEEDELDEAELSSWIEWCEADPRNLAAFESLQPVWHGARTHAPARRASASRRRAWLPGAVAAAAAVVIVAGGVVFEKNRRSGSSRVAAVDLVQTPIAGNRQAVLPDGSQIEVGARSSVAVDFAGQARQLELRDGEAFFQVKHDRNRPFIVRVRDLQIVAIGTAFNVRRAGAEIAVTVQEGVVEVRGGSRERPQRAVAGEQLVYDTGTGAVREAIIDPAVALAWRTGRLEFTGDSLQSVVESVNRYATRPIVLGDPSLAQLTFTGTVFFDSIDAWLDSLPQIFPVSVDRSGGGEIALMSAGGR